MTEQKEMSNPGTQGGGGTAKALGLPDGSRWKTLGLEALHEVSEKGWDARWSRKLMPRMQRRKGQGEVAEHPPSNEPGVLQGSRRSRQGLRTQGRHSLHRLTPASMSFTKSNHAHWTSLLVQGLRLSLPIQGTGLQPLLQEDSTCHGATKPETTELTCVAPKPHNKRITALSSLSTTRCSPCSLQLEKAHTHQQRPERPKTN